MEQFAPNSLLDGFCMTAVIVVAIYNYYCMRKGKNGTGYLFFVIFIFLFSLFYRPVGGDFWGYLIDYQSGIDVEFYYKHMESIYYWLMELIPNNYLLWRTAIWFPAAVFIALIYKRLRIDSANTTVFFLAFALLQSYYYLRNSLGFSVLCFGMVFFCAQYGSKNKIRNWILAIALMGCTWFLHRSMPLYIFFAILAIILPFRKKYVIWALVAMPILYGLVLLFAPGLLNVDGIWTDNVGMAYLEVQNTFTSNWKGIFSYVIKHAPIVYFYIIAFSKPLSKESPDFIYYKVFLLYSFFIYCLSFLFLGQASIHLHNRFYYTSLFSFAFVVSLYFKHNLKSKQCDTFILLMSVYYAWSLFLSLTSVVR